MFRSAHVKMRNVKSVYIISLALFQYVFHFPNHDLFICPFHQFVPYVYRGGSRIISYGGAHLKKLRRTEGGAKILGVFRVKNHNFTPKIIFFSNFRGGARRVRPPPPGSAPGIHRGCIKAYPLHII